MVVYWKLDMDPEELEQSKQITCARPKANKCGCFKCLKGEVVLKACTCCYELLDSLGRVRINVPDCEIKELKMHLGIGAGQVFDVHVVGDETRVEHFVAGDAVNQLSVVLNVAQPGTLSCKLLSLP